MARTGFGKTPRYRGIPLPRDAATAIERRGGGVAVYLSFLLVDVGENPDRPRPGRLWLRNRYRVHQRLCMGFPSSMRKQDDPAFLKPFAPDGFQHVHGRRTEEQAFLFRVDPWPGGRAVVLVQSGREPDWDYAFHNAGHLLVAPPETKPYNPAFTAQQLLRFRLEANPTRKIDTKSGPDGRRRNGKRVPVKADGLEVWLASRAEALGFRIDHLDDVQGGYFHASKGNEATLNRLRSARYNGVLKVVDADRLADTLAHGIGPEKSYGCGLLSIAPAGQAP